MLGIAGTLHINLRNRAFDIAQPTASAVRN
jgi:hypothetical protein